MKTRKNSIIALNIILILVCGFICKDASYASKNEELILSCFELSKADIEEGSLSGWTVMDETFMDKQGLNSKLDALIPGLGFDESNIKKEIQTAADMSKAALYANKDSGTYHIIVESMRNDDGEEKSYCSFRAIYNGTYADIIQDKYFVEKVFLEAGMPIKLDMLITGSYEEKIAKEQVEVLVKKLLNHIKAYEVESMKDEETISVAAYSSQVGGYIYSRGRKVNVQLAMRYSQYRDKTYLLIGSPVIPFEY